MHFRRQRDILLTPQERRSRLTLACAARQAGEAERLLDEAERWLSGQDFELGSRMRELVSLDDGDRR